jgi:hypothetical protein
VEVLTVERTYTLDQLAQILQVPVQALEAEIDAGRLRRLTIAGGLIRVTESDFNAYKTLASDDTTPGAKVNSGSRLETIPDFTYVWPNANSELFSEAREGLIFHGGKEHRVKIGFTVRKAAGQDRRRALVLVDGYPTVEFVSADVTSNGITASIIRNRDGKQLPVGAMLPPEYRGMATGPYRDVVTGPRTSNGLAVMSRQDDFDTMLRHALIRYQFRKDRK